MSTLTARLSLNKPAAGDTVNVTTDINNNMDQIDTFMNFASCTSGTRPSVKWDGLSIHETDTNKCYVWNSSPATSGWYEIFTPSTSLSTVNVTSSTSAIEGITLNVSGDTNKRFQVRADGRIEFGPGNAVTDTFLRRTGSNALTTDGTLTVTGTTTVSSTTDSTAVNVSGGGTFAKSLTVGGTASLGGSVGALNLKNITTAPTAGPTSGLLVYSDAGRPAFANPQFNIYYNRGGQYGSTVSNLTNTVTETTLITVVIPANEVVADGIYRLTAFGNNSTSATATSMTIRTKLNGSTMLSSGAVTCTASMTTKQWNLESLFRFRSPGASANVYNQIALMHRWDNSNTPSTTPIVHDSHATGASVATNSQVTLAITGQWGAASSSNILTTQGWYFERVL